MAGVTLIGLDGVNWTVLEHAIEKGKMPYLESILEEGSRAELETTQPPLTGPAWTCIMTGQNPGRHGVYGFVNPVNGRPYSSSDIQTETIYEAVSRHGDVSVVNLPLSHPPRFTGEYVGSFMAPDDDFYRPESLADIHDFGSYKKSLSGIEKSTRVVSASERVARSKLNLVEKMLDDQDFFFLLFSAPDWIMHNHYHRMKNGEANRPFKPFRVMDRAIEIADQRSDNLILMSDHGFQDFDRSFHVNQWLREEGLLEVEGSMGTAWIDNRAVEAVFSAVSRHRPLRKLCRGIYLGVEDLLPLSENVKVRIASNLSEGIDMERSRAFCPSSDIRGIYVNDGRFESVVEDREEVVDRITGALPEGVKAHRREDIYQGEDLSAAPDIVIEELDAKVSRGIYGEVFSDRQVNHHGKYGFFWARGDELEGGRDIGTISLCQVAPTVAELFDLEFDSDHPALPIVEGERGLEGLDLPDDF